MLEEWTLVHDLLPGFALKIGMAVVCGCLLGIERERSGKPAGLRTIVLITVGATLYMIVSDLIALATDGPEAITRVDTSRIASQVVTGIGFLGAGSIIQARGSVHGLTTAATIWVAAGLGLCVGAGFPLLALGTTLIVLLVLTVLAPLRSWVGRRGAHHAITFLMASDTMTRQRVMLTLEEFDVPDDAISISPEPEEDDSLRVEAGYQMNSGSALRMLEALCRIEGVRGLSDSDDPAST